MTHTFKLVDTCAAEFEAYTPYFYSTYEEEDECRKTERDKVVILGGGPNRIGQGIEFDYCCVHASFALRRDGHRVHHGQLQPGDGLHRLRHLGQALLRAADPGGRSQHRGQSEKPWGVIVQFGGQTPLNLAVPLEAAGVPILGTPPDAIDRAEDRDRFSELLRKLELAPAGQRHLR